MKDKTIYKCKFCGKECVGLSGLHFHENRCKENPNHKNTKEYKYVWVNDGNITKRILNVDLDKYLDSGWSRGYDNNFKLRCSSTKGQKMIFINNGIIDKKIKYNDKIPDGWNKGLRYNHNPSGKCKDPIKEQERRKKISLKMKGNKQSGYHKGCGRGKKGWYKGIFCDSTWELAYVIYCIDHNIKIERNKQMFDYEYNGEIHKYLPDFIINGQLVEVKGWKDPKWLVKEKIFKNIKIIDKDEIQKYIDYVKNTYNCKELVDMYEYRNKKECLSD